MQKYIVWYKTRSGNYSREIPFKSLEKATSLFNALERDFKYLIGVDNNENLLGAIFIPKIKEAKVKWNAK